MKKIINGVVIPTVIAVFIGFILGKYVFKTYKDNLYDELRSSRLYLLESGEYDTIDEMREENNSNNYVYYIKDNKYKTVVGITNKYDNVDKIKSLYSNRLNVMEYYIPNDSLDNRQIEYDNKLLVTEDGGEVREIVDNILRLYRESNSMRLIKG